METDTLSPAHKRKIRKIFGISLFAIPAIVLPTGALLAELVMRLCSGVFFDPLPSVAHILLVALVPCANLHALRVLEKRSARISVAEFLNGAALAISLVYAFLFLPVMPLAAMYTAFSVGALFLPAVITLLPFAPLAAFICGVFLLRRLRRQTTYARKRSQLLAAIGFACGLSSLALAESPRFITTLALANLHQNPENISAIRMLRSFGEPDMILRAAYGDTNALRDFRTWIASMSYAKQPWMMMDRGPDHPIDPQQARALYYRVTGASFNSVPAPTRASGGWLFPFTNDVGGKGVGERSEDVSLVSSTIDGSMSAETMTSYVEWTMVFKNEHQFLQEEARAEIALPPGGVVSRVTLWINDEEVEALMGSRAEARAAYERVVFRKRDPLLVTSAGPDRVLVQCFPIPPKGGEMKIRLGITAPLVLADKTKAHTRLPSFMAQNFRLNETGKHLVWFESHDAFTTNRPEELSIEKQQGVFKAQGNIPTNEDMSKIAIELSANELKLDLLSKDNEQLIHQQLVERAYPGAPAIVLVIDGSVKTKDYLGDLLAAIRTTLRGKTVNVVFAGDAVEMLTDGFVEMTETELDRVLAKLRRHEFRGGADGVLALRDALSESALLPQSTIVWLHSGKPIQSTMLPSLEQYVRRTHAGPRIVSIPLGIDSDRLDEQLENLGLLQKLPLALRELPFPAQLAAIASGSPYWAIERTNEIPPETESNLSEYPHVNRLWGADKVAELVQMSFGSTRGAASFKDEALKVALRYRIVTPISGAVVLEKTDASNASNLSPAEPGKVPAIPEPEMIFLFLTLALLLVLYRGQQTYGMYAKRF